MNHLAEQAQPASPVTRAGLAIGFVVLALAAVSFNSGAATASRAVGLPVAMAAAAETGFAQAWTEQVDWSKVQSAAITPAESVAAYDR